MEPVRLASGVHHHCCQVLADPQPSNSAFAGETQRNSNAARRHASRKQRIWAVAHRSESSSPDLANRSQREQHPRPILQALQCYAQRLTQLTSMRDLLALPRRLSSGRISEWSDSDSRQLGRRVPLRGRDGSRYTHDFSIDCVADGSRPDTCPDLVMQTTSQYTGRYP